MTEGRNKDRKTGTEWHGLVTGTETGLQAKRDGVRGKRTGSEGQG